jgi:putative membrane protein
MSAEQQKNAEAKERTDLAEDRTVLANERTFASWFRTGFAAVAIGLAFQALFVQMQPLWVPRAIATWFNLLGIFLFIAAERRACQVLSRLSPHQVNAFNHNRLRLMTIAASAGAVALIAAMWLLPMKPS